MTTLVLSIWERFSYSLFMASLERELHQWLRQQIGGSLRPDVLIGVGDDAAVVAGSNHPQVITTDTIADGTHFLTAKHSLELIGRKSLAINLSDIAAMGAEPKTAVLHWFLPRSFSSADAKSLFDGIKHLADQYYVQIIGGDTNCWDGPLVIGATVIGQLESFDNVWRISGASPGDAVYVSGKFGGSIRGHHLSFEPVVELAKSLAATGIVSAATDASDSLASDLNAIAAASGCGAELMLGQIPIADAAYVLARDSAESSAKPGSIDQRALDHALTDGEDFGLILGVPQEKESIIEQDVTLRNQLTRIGTFTERTGLWSVQTDGTLEPIQPQGYDH
jgi:thiamine-monophosphate kinase